MRYAGSQLRMARAATGMTFRAVCRELSLSPKTLTAVERAEVIGYGVKQKGCFEEQTIARLVELYEQRGVTFLANSAQGYGIRFLSTDTAEAGGRAPVGRSRKAGA